MKKNGRMVVDPDYLRVNVDQRNRMRKERVLLPELVGPIPVKGGTMGNDGCLERVPYASLMATITLDIGVILFALMMTWGFNAAVEQTRRTLHIEDWPWLDRIQIIFVCIAIIVVFVSLFLLAVGVAATGSTREQMFKASEARCGGRIACAIAVGMAFILLIAWLLIIGLSGVLLALYASLNAVCASLPAYTEDNCIDLRFARPLVVSFSDASMNVCGGDAQQFCALSATALAWFIVGFIGAALVSIGLGMFIITHSANYSHISHANRYVELRDVAYESFSQPVVHPYRGGKGQVMDTWSPPPPPSSTGISSSRQAEQHTDSVSQYAYGRRNMR